MMSKDEAEVVKIVYNRFMESEESLWSDIDENIVFFSYLLDSEMIREASIKYEEHSRGIFRCEQNHKQEFCFAPYILEAVGAILKLYENTGVLHPKNRYILSYYMSMSELRILYTTEVSGAL